MTIARKPKRVEDFISGSNLIETEGIVDEIEQAASIQALKLRVPKELLAAIDRAYAHRKPKPSRNNFILEALYEKVERESKSTLEAVS